MPDPYYIQYLYDSKKTDAPVSYGIIPKQPTLPDCPPTIDIAGIDKPYWPASSDSLDAMIHDTKTYGLDVTDLIMQDKLKLLGTNVALLRHQINERSKILDDNLATIEGKVMKCESYIDTLAQVWPAFANPMVEAKRGNLYHEMSNLNSQKLKETVDCWGDQVRLYSELLKTLGEYQAAARRFKLLDGDEL